MNLYDENQYYINRELSWLSFNERVLEEALDHTNPLFERLKFLVITSANLDEFFMVRVAGLKEQIKLSHNKPDNKEGMTPIEQLTAIFAKTNKLVNSQYQLVYNSIIPELNDEAVYILKTEELDEEQELFAENYFKEKVYPVLTPMAIDASHPFPMLLNISLNLAVVLQEKGNEDRQVFALVEVPSVLPRLVTIPSKDGKVVIILLEDLISKYIGLLFQGNEIISVSPFRITKNADLDLDEEGVDDLLITIQKELKKRNLGSAVRLEVDYSMDPKVLKQLKESLNLADYDIYSIKGPLDLTFLMKIYELPQKAHLKFIEQLPVTPEGMINGKDIFAAIIEKDILLHHPYESFEPVVRFIQQAADDPNVLAIKQTLYRVSGNSPIIKALAKAAENGKQVTVLVELKARFDEKNNISWAKKLEEAGCHVIYGVAGLKTHSKISLIVRLERDTIRRYVHLSTGNYNDMTARFYTDIGMFTCRNEFGEDASEFFNHLSGYSNTPKWNRITTAPNGLKDRFIELIENEIDRHTEDRPGRIIAKMNSLTNKDIITALYRASKQGVQIDLIIRGICCLRPGIEGVSENIRVISIVGRFLEHSRIFYFNNGGEELVYLSSADWMTRNLDYRVEILFPVIQKDLKTRIKKILDTNLRDNVRARILNSDGTYSKVEAEELPLLESQIELYHDISNNVKIKELNFYSK